MEEECDKHMSCIKDLEGRIAIITGAAQGIGLACAKKLAEHGAKVIGVDINGLKLESAAAVLAGQGLQVEAIQADITRHVQVKALVENVAAKYNKIDILVNNAGIIDDTPISELNIEKWNKVLEINLLGSQLCTFECVKHMIKNQYGRLVFISSRAGQMGSPLVNPSYSVSKAGDICLSKAYANYVAPYNIVSNAVAPAFIETEMVRGADNVDSYPMKRMGTPEEIANVVYFLSSDLCSYVNGVTIEANGGQYIR